MVAAVEPDSLADIAGMREGDFIIAVGDRDVKWSSHEEVVRLTRAAGDSLTLRLASPMDAGAKASPDASRQSRSNQGSVSAASTSSGSTAPRPRRAPSWNPFKRHSAQRPHGNLIYR